MKVASTNTTIDDRMIALMRLLLAAAAFLIVLVDPSEPDRHVPFTYGALVAYVIYSAVVYANRSQGRGPIYVWPLRQWPFVTWKHWVDIAWYTLLIALSSGTNSIFFFFYIFAIIVASFLWGFGPGLRAAIVSALLFSVVGYFTAPTQPAFDLNRFLLRPTYLLLLGYTIAALGGYEVRLRQRLFLLKDMNSLSNPRFGIGRTLGTLTELLRHFYDADKCVMVMREWHQLEPHLRSALREKPEAAMQSLPLTLPMQRQLLELPETQTLWQSPTPMRRFALIPCSALMQYFAPVLRLAGIRTETSPRLYVFNHRTGAFCLGNATSGDAKLETLGTTLDAEEFFSSPICYRGTLIGRLFILRPRRKFSGDEALFLLQALEHVVPSLDNILLLDRLASDAAESERQRIARDLHDSIIQPYIGLRIGLTALSEELYNGHESVESRVESVEKRVQHLIEMTDMGITELRDYVTNMKTSALTQRGLKSSIERFVEKFTAASTIQVDIQMDAALNLNDRLAAEVFQMIAEGLSNIRRHTNATRARIQLEQRAGHLELLISNQGTAIESSASSESSTGAENPGALPSGFTPRSITGRAIALGGSAQVRQDEEQTVVQVQIPL